MGAHGSIDPGVNPFADWQSQGSGTPDDTSRFVWTQASLAVAVARPRATHGTLRSESMTKISTERHFMMRPIKEQSVVITGASSGIGRQTALLFARRGASVILGARNDTALKHVAEEIRRGGGKAQVV